METSRRYKIQLIGDAPATPKPPAHPQKSKMDVHKAETGHKKAAPSPVPELHPDHWSVRPMSAFQLGVEGVHLETSMDSAQQHGRQLTGAKGAVALLSVQPLAAARRTERITFVIQRKKPGEHATQQVVEGYLSQFGTHDVLHVHAAQQVTARQGEPTTLVLSVLAAKSTVSKEEWDKIRSCSDIPSLRKALANAAPNMLYEDVFRLQVTESKVSFLVRIRKSMLQMWLQAEGLPCTSTPLGEDNMNGFKILWDKQAVTLADVRTKYQAVRGFTGVVQTPKGLGARISQEFFDTARSASALPTANSYLLKGIPVEMPVQHITTLLEDLKWKATPLPESRRTRGRTATIRVRADQPPTSMLYRITSGAEAYTVHIEKAEPKPRVPKPIPTEPPETWAEAAKRAMGKSVVEQHGTQSAVPHDFHVPVLPVVTQAQDNADQDMGSAHEEDTDEEDTDSFDDRFVEAEPSLVQTSAPKRRKGAKRIRQPGGSSSKVRQIEHDMQVLREQVQLVLTRLTVPSAGPFSLPIPQPVRAKIDPCQVSDVEACQPAQVPGDGDCLWHACCAWHTTQMATPQSTEAGTAHKHQILRHLRANAPTFAHAWGCEAQGLLSACEHWNDNWVDARALLSISLIEQVYIIILNRRDAAIEVIGPKPWSAGDEVRCWLLEFGSDHYNPVKPPTVDWFARVLALAQFEPWKTPPPKDTCKEELASPSLGHEGGPGAARRRGDDVNLNVDWYCEAVNKWAKHDGSPSMLVHTCNITSWRRHASRVLHHLDSQGQHVICFQETGTSTEQQRAATAALNMQGYQIIWGDPTPRRPKKRRGWTLDRLQCPGVAIVHSSSLTVYPCAPKTEQAQILKREGRLVMAMVETLSGQSHYIMNVYLPSGSADHDRKLQMQRTIAHEIFSWASTPGLLCGDFNLDLEQSALVAQLAPLGWRLPLHVTPDGVPRQTRIDDIIAHPDMLFPTDAVVLTQIDGLQHCLLTAGNVSGTHPDLIPVRHPPCVQVDRERALTSPVCWQTAAARARQWYLSLSHVTDQWINMRAQLDVHWHEYLTLGIRYLDACHPRAQHETGGSYKGQFGRDWKRPKRGQGRGHATSLPVPLLPLRKALRRLISLAEDIDNPNIIRRLQHHAGTLKEAFAMSDPQFVDALEQPAKWIPIWQDRMKVIEQREHQRQIQRWRRKLTTHAHRPTRSLYRWLRQGPKRGHYTTTHQGTRVSGPATFFDVQRSFWNGLMNRDPQEASETHQMIHMLPPVPLADTLEEDEVDTLYASIQALKPWTSGGLDCWPPSAIRGLPREACYALAWLYKPAST